jgi:hypothetical protein
VRRVRDVATVTTLVDDVVRGVVAEPMHFATRAGYLFGRVKKRALAAQSIARDCGPRRAPRPRDPAVATDATRQVSRGADEPGVNDALL